MARIARLLLLLVAAAGCNRGGGATPQPTGFPQFVREQVNATADDTDPVDINGIDFVDRFAGDGFDDLLN